MKFPRKRLLTLALCIALCAASGCYQKQTVRSQLTAHLDGREVVAVIDGPAMIQPGSDSATVVFGSHKVVIEKERVVVDGKEISKLPAAAARVELGVTDGTLTITAESKPVATTKLTR